MSRWLTAIALAIASAAWLFAGPLFGGRVLYFRDVSVTYYPDLVFVSRALAQGTWPLWHPGADAGAPFLASYPLHLLLAGLASPRAALALSPPLHVLLGILGAFLLARRLGTGFAGAFVSGMVYGLSGLMLGSVLYPVFLAAAWAPLAIALFLSLEGRRTFSGAALLAAVLALQVSTLGVEVLPQTALVALVLLPRRPRARHVQATLAALGIGLLLAAPVLMGSLALLSGSARGRGFGPADAVSYSATPAVLVESLLPRFLGDPHTFSDVGFWAQPFFPAGSPFFLSLYLGPVVLLLALLAGARERRLWALLAAGVVLALGAFGPVGPVLATAMGPMRGPVKFFLLATLALALLCGRGLDRAAERGRRWALVPAVLVLLLAVLASRWPGAVTAALGVLFPGPNPALVHDVVARLWPAELLATGTAALGAGLALARGGRVAVLAGVLAAVDLLRVNGGLNPTAPASFYELRPEVRAAVADAQAEGRYRWFTYGAGYAEALRWRPEVARTRRDVWLYAVDRQALVPRSHVIDGLEGAFDVDRMGLAPEGAALPVAEMRPSAHAALQRRLELANVRFILSFDAIEDARLRLRATIDIGEVLEPLRLHEVRRPLPRAFFVPRHEVEPSPEARRTRLEGFDPREAVILDSEPPAGPWIRTLPSIGSTDAPRGPAGPGESPASVTYDLVDPHTVRVASATPPGYVVVLDGHHPDWTAHDERGAPVPVLRANGRYRAIPTPGGRHVFTLRYRPRWLTLALGSLAAGLAAAAVLAGVSEFTARRGTRRANLRAGTQE